MRCISGIVLLAAVVAVFVPILGDQAMSQSQDISPSLVPQSELRVSNAPSFVASCMARITPDVEKFSWRIGNSILTQSDQWGLVWRADFQTKAESEQSRYVNRVVCWRRPGETDVAAAFAFGQKVERL